ncbi:MAG: hypothetical protein AB1486_33450 [Planctomycetota bacterium]
MQHRWLLLALLSLLANLLLPGITSASSPAGTETRVGAFGLAEQAFVRSEAALTLDLHRGCGLTYDRLASDSLLAPKGGGQTGSYVNTHESGTVYVGKGTEERAARSGREKAKEHNDPLVKTEHEPASSNRQAFKDEHRKLEEHGGPDSPENYNKINSPGKKYTEEDGE